MKNRTMVLLLLLLIPLPAAAQDLNVLEDQLNSYLSMKMQGWKHKGVQPIQGSEKTLVGVWSFSNRNVKVTVVPYKSQQDAQEAFRGFLKYQIEREDLK